MIAIVIYLAIGIAVATYGMNKDGNQIAQHLSIVTKYEAWVVLVVSTVIIAVGWPLFLRKH